MGKERENIGQVFCDRLSESKIKLLNYDSFFISLFGDLRLNFYLLPNHQFHIAGILINRNCKSV